MPEDYDKIVPEQKTIYRFLRVLFTAAQLTAECAIVTLVRRVERKEMFFFFKIENGRNLKYSFLLSLKVYLERVLSYGELDLCPSNWKRLVLGKKKNTNLQD